MVNEDAGTAASVQKAQVRERWVLTVSTAGLAAIWVPLALLGDVDGTQELLTYGGMLLFILAGAAAAWMAWRPRPRPAATLDPAGDETLLTASRWPLAVLLVGATGWAVLAAAIVLGEGLASAAADGRRGAFLYVFVPLAPVVLLAAVVVAARPLQVGLSTGGVVVRRAWQQTAIAWDQVEHVGPWVAPGPNTGAPVELRVASRSKATVVATRYLPCDQSTLVTYLLHYRDTAAHRAELGAQASLDRLADPGRPSPY